MKLVLTTVLVAFGSAVFPLINIEAYLGAVGVAIENVGAVPVAAAAAVGQTAGKVVLYYAADWAMRLPWMRKKMSTPKWQTQYEKWRERIADHPGQTTLLLLASSALGFPPLLVIAVLAGHLRVNIWLFVSTCVSGRFVRFLVLLGAADWLVHTFHQIT
ncbi:MAG: VTT domain-containing protein [Marmoricola sp.]